METHTIDKFRYQIMEAPINSYIGVTNLFNGSVDNKKRRQYDGTSNDDREN